MSGGNAGSRDGEKVADRTLLEDSLQGDKLKPSSNQAQTKLTGPGNKHVADLDGRLDTERRVRAVRMRMRLAYLWNAISVP